jgi:hypothetical protein
MSNIDQNIIDSMASDARKARVILNNCPDMFVVGMGAQALIRMVPEAGKGAYNMSGNPLTTVKYRTLRQAELAAAEVRSARGDEYAQVMRYKKALEQFADVTEEAVRNLTVLVGEEA